MGNHILIGLSGGPSAAINASLAGILSAATKNEKIGTIYGALHGIEGVLNRRMIDLAAFCDEQSLKLLEQTPAMALGSCRHKLKEEELPQVEQVMRELGIGCFFYIGGNDSMDTVLQLDSYFKANSVPIKVIGVPKTIDNDLPVTDHTPGFGSSAKYLYHTMSEIVRDSEIYPVESVTIVEVMGRNSGWLTLAAGLPRFLGGHAPHIIAIPEVPFDEQAFLQRIRLLQKTERAVICAVSEGIRDKGGNYVGMATKSGAVDIFGHTYLSGVGKYLEGVVARELGCKVRSVELNIMQRCSAHLASKTDIDEARLIGEKAVETAMEGRSGITMVFERMSDNPYAVRVSCTNVANIANKARDIPRCWFDLEDRAVQKQAAAYLLPLIQGEIVPVRDETGLPIYINMHEKK